MADIKICCSHSKMVNIHELVEHPKNPNKHPAKQLEMLAKIIEAQGFRRPIVVSSRSGYVIIGHGRLQAARLLGMEQVPVDYQDYKTEAAEYADMVADNKIAELAEFDNTIFKDILKDIDDGFDFDLFGVKDNELNALLAENSADEVSEDNIDYESAIETARKNPRIQFGQVAVLGRHRLMCGDSTNALSVGQLMDGKLANMVFTDPPYNVNYQGNTKDKLKIKNDNMKPADFAKFLAAAMANLYEASAPGAAIYVCHADSAGTDFRQCMANAGWQVKQCLIWVKNSFVMGRQDYQWQHEPILYGWKPGAAHKFYGGRKQSSVIENVPFIVEEQEDGSKHLHFVTSAGEIVIKATGYEVLPESEGTIWRVPKPTKNAEHPTMKPITLCARAIINSCPKNGNVLDLFGGSGSTLIACEQVDRTCFTMELDPIYATVIINRFEAMTGIKAVVLE